MKILLFIFAALTTQHAFAKTWTDIYKQNKPGVVFIFSRGGLCSGALISEKLVLTAWHCVAFARPIHVGWSDDPENSIKASIVGGDTENDLAILELENKVTRPALSIVDENFVLNEGDPIATIGHPMGSGLDDGGLRDGHTYIMSAGIVSRIGEKYIVTDAAINPGNSGGPVFNADGKIIAVVSAKLGGVLVDNIGYVISYKHIHKLLKSVTEAQKQRQKLRLPAPKNTLYVGFQYFYDAQLAREYNANKDGFSLEVGTFLYDRFHLAWNRKFASSPDYPDFAVDQFYLGYQFQCEVTNSFVLFFTPAVARKYVYSSNNTNDVVNLIALRAHVLGFNLTYEGNIRHWDQRAMSLGFALWNW